MWRVSVKILWPVRRDTILDVLRSHKSWKALKRRILHVSAIQILNDSNRKEIAILNTIFPW